MSLSFGARMVFLFPLDVVVVVVFLVHPFPFGRSEIMFVAIKMTKIKQKQNCAKEIKSEWTAQQQFGSSSTCKWVFVHFLFCDATQPSSRGIIIYIVSPWNSFCSTQELRRNTMHAKRWNWNSINMWAPKSALAFEWPKSTTSWTEMTSEWEKRESE